MVGDAKGHLYDFLEVFGHKTKAETANAIIAAFDKAIQLMDEADDETDAAKILQKLPKSPNGLQHWRFLRNTNCWNNSSVNRKIFAKNLLPSAIPI